MRNNKMVFEESKRPAPRGSARRARAALAAAFFLLFCAPSAFAYDDDTHFWLTYYLARKSGYTQYQAWQIAGANISVDYDADTNPVFPSTFHPQDIRARLHALPSTKRANECEREASVVRPALSYDEVLAMRKTCVDKFIDEAEQSLWQDALSTGNPGAFLHYYQDRFAHAGFTSRWGHASAKHYPDFLSSDRGKAERMVEGTLKVLRKFMQEYLKPQTMPAEPPGDEIKATLDKMIAASPADRDKRPNPVSAREIIKAALADEEVEIWIYDLGHNGRPEKDKSQKRRFYLPPDTTLYVADRRRSDHCPIPWKLSPATDQTDECRLRAKQ